MYEQQTQKKMNLSYMSNKIRDELENVTKKKIQNIKRK